MLKNLRKEYTSSLLIAAQAVMLAIGSVEPAALAGESTMPASYVENIDPQMAAKYAYTEDGKYTQSLDIPTYQWMPTQVPLKAIVLAVHGLTLHGRRFRVLARALAVNGIGFVALDMRGFGRCRFDDKKQFSTKDDDKTKVNHEKSYADIVRLAQLIKADYPDKKLIGMGESLGCTFCVRLAAEHPELVDLIALSAPAVHVNRDMYAGRGQIRQGVRALLIPHHGFNLEGFFAELCSANKDIQQEMIDDPLIVKNMPLKSLIATDAFVDKTEKWGKQTSHKLPVFILQGSADGCVSPKRVTDLMNAMPSDDQSLAWRGNFGHLQLETMYMRPQSVDAVASWLLSHGKEYQGKLQQLQQDIVGLGGTLLH